MVQRPPYVKHFFSLLIDKRATYIFVQVILSFLGGKAQFKREMILRMASSHTKSEANCWLFRLNFSIERSNRGPSTPRQHRPKSSYFLNYFVMLSPPHPRPAHLAHERWKVWGERISLKIYKVLSRFHIFFFFFGCCPGRPMRGAPSGSISLYIFH